MAAKAGRRCIATVKPVRVVDRAESERLAVTALRVVGFAARCDVCDWTGQTRKTRHEATVDMREHLDA